MTRVWGALHDHEQGMGVDGRWTLMDAAQRRREDGIGATMPWQGLIVSVTVMEDGQREVNAFNENPNM